MPRMCYITGKKTTTGNNRSHSMRATKRTFKPNLVTKRVELEDGSKVKIKVSTKAYKKMKGFMQ